MGAGPVLLRQERSLSTGIEERLLQLSRRLDDLETVTRRFARSPVPSWSGPAPSAEATFRIVVICTGNRFRSPLAAELLRRHTDGLPVAVESVGTLDAGSHPALDEAIALGRDLGFDLGSHRSRALRQGRLADADLVVGFELHHVAAAIDLGARPARTFTLPELVALLDGHRAQPGEDAVARAREALEAADDLRSRLGRGASMRELADPQGQSEAVFRETAAALERLCGELARRLFGGGERPGEARPGGPRGVVQ